MLSVLKLSIGNYNACPCLVYVYFGKNILKISSNKFQKPRPYFRATLFLQKENVKNGRYSIIY